MPFAVGDSVRLVYPFGTHEQGPGGLTMHAAKEATIALDCLHSVGGGKGIYTITEGLIVPLDTLRDLGLFPLGCQRPASSIFSRNVPVTSRRSS